MEHNDDNYLPSELSFDHLLLILRSPLLKSIKICQSRNFTDQCFENIFSLNSLRHLEHLELTKCDEICFISLEILLEQENCLTNVKLVKCEQGRGFESIAVVKKCLLKCKVLLLSLITNKRTGLEASDQSQVEKQWIWFGSNNPIFR